MTHHYVAWRKPTRSEPSNACVLVGITTNGTVGLRDTKDRGQGHTFSFSMSQWLAFTELAGQGGYGLARPGDAVRTTLLAKRRGAVQITASWDPNAIVIFTQVEWAAFRVGIAKGEFTEAALQRDLVGAHR